MIRRKKNILVIFIATSLDLNLNHATQEEKKTNMNHSQWQHPFTKQNIQNDTSLLLGKTDANCQSISTVTLDIWKHRSELTSG